MNRKFSGHSFFSVSGISHESKDLPRFHCFTCLKIFFIGCKMGIIKIPSMRRTDSDPVSAKRKPSDFFYFAISHGNHRIKSGLRNPAKEIAAFVHPASTIASGSAKGVFIKNLLPYFSIVSDRNGKIFQVFPDSQITVSQVIIGFVFEAQICFPVSGKIFWKKFSIQHSCCKKIGKFSI